MTFPARQDLRQRADYTHKFNAKTGRHGWLRLTPAYSVKIVEELISRCERPMRILDPFCGTATTGLSAAYHGHAGVTTDVNPFLVWLGKVKTAKYSQRTLVAVRESCAEALSLVARESIDPVPPPPIHKVERWWPPAALMFLRRLRAALEVVTEDGTPEKSLLLVAFCRTLIALSNAAFNHQSMSFKDGHQASLLGGDNMSGVFSDDVRFVLSGASQSPDGECSVLLGDARALPDVVDGVFDRVITSPPYVNRMSYIRELRPYMYWLGFLTNGRDAGELDWSAIGGTWGIATSRLVEWQRNGERVDDALLDNALDRIADKSNKSGEVLSKYVAKYFDDMLAHFRGLTRVVAAGAEVHYVVGNSTFYGVLLSAEEIYASMLRGLGFEAVECRPIRKRNSKKELIEFDVTARWPG